MAAPQAPIKSPTHSLRGIAAGKSNMRDDTVIRMVERVLWRHHLCSCLWKSELDTFMYKPIHTYKRTPLKLVRLTWLFLLIIVKALIDCCCCCCYCASAAAAAAAAAASASSSASSCCLLHLPFTYNLHFCTSLKPTPSYRPISCIILVLRLLHIPHKIQSLFFVYIYCVECPQKSKGTLVTTNMFAFGRLG